LTSSWLVSLLVLASSILALYSFHSTPSWAWEIFKRISLWSVRTVEALDAAVMVEFLVLLRNRMSTRYQSALIVAANWFS
jgi:hypothetical protein